MNQLTPDDELSTLDDAKRIDARLPTCVCGAAAECVFDNDAADGHWICQKCRTAVIAALSETATSGPSPRIAFDPKAKGIKSRRAIVGGEERSHDAIDAAMERQIVNGEIRDDERTRHELGPIPARAVPHLAASEAENNQTLTSDKVVDSLVSRIADGMGAEEDPERWDGQS
jgi:hypothetical protein